MSVKTSRLTVTIAVLIVLLNSVTTVTLVQAQGPTSTPTPTPTRTPFISPTPVVTATDFSNFRPTPSPFAITPVGTPILNTAIQADQLADSAINAYRFVNIGGVVDMILFFVTLALIFRALFHIAKKAQETG